METPKCMLSNKKIQPSPWLKNLVPGRGIEFEELTERVTKIHALAQPSQRIIVSSTEPTEISENDFWYEITA